MIVDLKRESAQYHFLIDDRDTASQHNNTELGGDVDFGAEGRLTSLRGSAIIVARSK
jgi:hypothetical protein